MSTPRLRVFLSYGRRDAAPLADLLVPALQAQGIAVWRDTAQLRAGRSWEQQITTALDASDVVLALLSPHSTRSIPGGSNDDSVCLDELAAARYSHPSRPVVPVLAVAGASTPLTVLRLHQLDFTAAATDPADLARRLPGLVQALDDAVAGRTAMRGWERWLGAPPDAGAFLHAKHRGFTGRHWLFGQIDRWRLAPGAPVLLVQGEPGIGKSAVVAELSIGAQAGATLATHCCQWDVADSLRPATLVRALAQQCALRLPAYAALLDDEHLRPYFERADSDPGAAIEHGLLGPLADVGPPPGGDGPWLWCIDALDEALLHRAGPTIVDLLASRLDRLPGWLRIVATTRNDTRVLRALGDAHAAPLQAGTPDNLDDLRRHVQATLARLQADGQLPAGTDAARQQAVVDAVLARSRGSFLYADFVLRALARGQLDGSSLPDLPPGLNGVYERELRRALPGDAAIAALRPVLAVLCAAQGPVPDSLLAASAGVRGRALPRLLLPIQPFLRQVAEAAPGDGPAWVFWHKSVHDFLTGDADADSPFAVDLQQGDALLAAQLLPRLAPDGQALPWPPYLRSHGLAHLAGSGRFLADLDDAALDRLLDALVAGSPSLSVGALPQAWPGFVAPAAQQQRWADLGRLLAMLAQHAHRGFEAAGLWTRQPLGDGREALHFTEQATQASPLAQGLLRALLAVSVLDQVRALRGTAPPFDQLQAQLRLVAHVANGLDRQGWSSGLSGYFEDQGMALAEMLRNLQEGRAAQDWQRRAGAG